MEQQQHAIDDYDSLLSLNKSEQVKLHDKLNNLECKICSTDSSLFWREIGIQIFVCNTCFQNKLYLELYKNKKVVQEQQQQQQQILPKKSTSKKQKVSCSSIKQRLNNKCQQDEDDENNNNSTNSQIISNKSRRNNIFKRFKPKKLQVVASCSVNTSEHVFHRGFYLQIDDIVSLLDDDGIFYAQIRGFLTDQYASKSAIITWLLPTSSANTSKFNENEFVLGPDEDFPRSLDCMKFVCRPKISYFKRKHLLYDTGIREDVKKNCLNLYTFSLLNDKKYHRTEWC
jgi:hypothetical protein